VIAGMTVHTGDVALAFHLTKVRDHERLLIRTHGVLAGDAFGGLAELRLMASDARTRTPILHAWASPRIEYDPDHWEWYWSRFESEMRLVGYPYVEAEHRKIGKGGRIATHRHRAYLRVAPNGRTVKMSHLAPRAEKLSRISEFMTGEPATSGIYNRSVIAALRKEGFAAVADYMAMAGLESLSARQAVSADDRAMTERLGDLSVDEVEERLWRAWATTATAEQFAAALKAAGLRLYMGAKVPVVVSPGGALVPLRRALSRVSQRHGSQSIRKADVDSRLAGLTLPTREKLGPVEGVEAGRFGTTGVTRLDAKNPFVQTETAPERRNDFPRMVTNTGLIPVDKPASPVDRPVTDVPVEVKSGPLDLSLLNQEQVAAIARYRDAFFAPALEPERAPEGETKLSASTDLQRWRRFLDTERNLYQQASLEEVGWRASYRAQLAGLPANLGARLAWVDKLERGRRRIVMKVSRTVITTEHKRVSASAPTLDTVAVILAHARAEGWRATTIRGGSPEWRQQLAREATLVGIAITNDDLSDVVANERIRIETRRVRATYFTARERARREWTPDNAKAFFAAAKVLGAAGELDSVLTLEEGRALERDLALIRERTDGEVWFKGRRSSMSGHSGGGGRHETPLPRR
jgi:hypothetical protein